MDTHHAVDIGYSPSGMLRVALAGVLMTTASVLVCAQILGPTSLTARLFGVVGVVLFGLCTLLAVWRVLTTHGAVVSLTPAGIRDSRVAGNLIPWSAVHDIRTWEHHGQRVMVLAIDPAIEAGLNLTRIARWTRSANRAVGADGLCIMSTGLKIDFDELLAKSMAHAQAVRSRRPGP